MSLQKTACLFVGIAVSVLLPLVSTHPAGADETKGVVRTFGFMTDVGNEDKVEGLFDGEDSVGVVVAGGPTIVMTICFEGTTWIHQSTTHITKGGDETPGIFFWLLDDNTPEPPPTGTFALTGPGNCIQEVSFVKYYLGGYVVADFGATDIFVVVTAVFNR